MVFSLISTALYTFFNTLYRALDDRVVYNLVVFVRGFEVAIFVGGATVFLLMAVVIMLRKAKRLPAAYEVKVIDINGNQVSIDGLRNNDDLHKMRLLLRMPSSGRSLRELRLSCLDTRAKS